MKKLIRLAALLTMFGMTACNSELGPEYTTLPEVSNLTLTPRIVHLAEGDEIEPVTEGQPVVLSCYFTNTYGWSRIYMSYRTLAFEEYDGKADIEIEQMWMKKFSSSDEEYKDMDYAVSYDAPVESKPFSFSIPGHAAGTRVRWDFGFFNQYGLGTGYMAAGRLPQNEYTVKASEPQQPVESDK